jgi:hypothetical protein
MFAGKWLLHLLGGGHTIVIGLAWLPLVLLFLEGAVRRGSLLWSTGAGVVFALLILGTQPQWTFYSGIFLVLWTFGPVLEEAGWFDGSFSWQRLRIPMLRWVLCGAWTAALAIALAAVQLLPTLEAAAQSSRAVGVAANDALGGGARSLLFLVGPTLSPEPFNMAWEDRCGFGLLWVFAAALAPLLSRGRVRYQAAICAVLLIFTFGGSALVQWLPGFNLFRQPARMAMIAALPVAFLAGAAVQALSSASQDGVTVVQRGRRLLLRVVVVVAFLIGSFAVRHAWSDHERLCFHIYWLTLLVTIPLTFWLLGRGRLQGLWYLVLLVDGAALVWPLVGVCPEEGLYQPSECVREIANGAAPLARVLDRDEDEEKSTTPLGAGTPLAMLDRLEALRGYNPLDNLRYKEYLQFITDHDKPLRPIESHFTYPVIGNFPVVNKSLLDLLGVRYLLQPAGRPVEGHGWRALPTDPEPSAYGFIVGGRQRMGPYALYANDDVLPRAFVIPRAAPLPAQPLAVLRTTDFRQQVWLEDFSPPSDGTTSGSYRPAIISDYLPNRVTVHVSGQGPGYLVLTDIWYPGWACTVDGQPARLYRANYLFRGVEVPAGEHDVVFFFAPQSYLRGRLISESALVLAAVLIVLAGVWGRIWKADSCSK